MANVVKMQIVQHDLESLQISVVVKDEWLPEQEDSIREEVRSRFGEEFKIDFKLVADIPTESSGKYRWVKSKIYEKTQLPRPLKLDDLQSSR